MTSPDNAKKQDRDAVIEPTPVEELLSILDLEPLEHNLFRGRSPKTGWQRVFGGQVIGQSLVAAQRTVPQERPVHSLHGYFLRPGDPAVPIIYEVDRIRDGGSFTTRRVVGIQHGKAIFSASISFHVAEDGLDFQFTMPEQPDPDTLLDNVARRQDLIQSAPDNVKRYWARPRPIQMVPTSLEHYLTDAPQPPQQNVWLRATGLIPNNSALQASVLAYASDMTLLDTALYPHGKKTFDADLMVASLDHSMWFHRPIDMNEWILFAQDTPNSNGGRGLTRGTLYAADGTLVASCAQEGLIRHRDPARPHGGLPKTSPLRKK